MSRPAAAVTADRLAAELGVPTAAELAAAVGVVADSLKVMAALSPEAAPGVAAFLPVLADYGRAAGVVLDACHRLIELVPPPAAD